MPRAIIAVSALGAVLYLGAAVWLARLERGGPAHADVMIEGGIPGTIYLPDPDDGSRPFVDVTGRSSRPPVVLLTHGFAFDRQGLSGLARTLARSGYAVLAIDLQGHGQNRNPYRRSRGRGDSFHGDVSAAIDHLRSSPHVDGSRIVVMGHSMGAGAVLDYATRDSGIDGVVLISGGAVLEGPYRPPNALFLVAEADPPLIRERSTALAAHIAGEATLELARTYGRPDRGTAVRLVNVPGANHIDILWNDAAAAEIVTWLDAIFSLPGAADRAPRDSRLAAVGLLWLALLLQLPGLGEIVGRIAPGPLVAPSSRGASGLVALALGFAAAMPLVATDSPAVLLSIDVGDVVIGTLALCGVLLLVAMRLRWGTAAGEIAAGGRRTFLAAAVALVAIYALTVPTGVAIHRWTFTPERAAIFGGCALFLLPFTAAFQLLLRGGTLAEAAAWCAGGRLLVLAALWVGVRLGLFAPVVGLILPVLVLVFVLIEVLAASIYGRSRNRGAIALIEAGWVALIMAASLPVRV
ncbi:MAG: alpha/beta hydrolase [Myxococcota bacterium]